MRFILGFILFGISIISVFAIFIFAGLAFSIGTSAGEGAGMFFLCILSIAVLVLSILGIRKLNKPSSYNKVN